MVHHKRSHRRRSNTRRRNVRRSRRSIRRNVRRSKRSRRMVGGWGAKKVGEKMYGGGRRWKNKIPSFKLYGGGWPTAPRQEPFIV